MRKPYSCCLVVVVVVVSALVSPIGCRNVPEDRDKRHVATHNQMVMRAPDGTVRFGVDTGSSYRAEVRQADGVVRGVYSQQVPGGHPQLIAYSSQGGAFNTVPLHALNIGLPPFPKSLYALQPQQAQEQAGANRNEGGVYVEDDMVVVGRLPASKVSPSAYQGEDAAKDDENKIDTATDKPAEEEEEEDYDEAEAVVVGDGPSPPGPLIPIPLPLPVQGSEAALSLPSVAALAGPQGIAQVSPSSTAIAGPGGVAVALPISQAVVGPGGLAISRPSSVAQAGVGGFALGGGHSVAIAGTANTAPSRDTNATVANATQAGQNETASAHNQQQPLNVGVYPIIANYFFGVPPSVSEWHQAAGGLGLGAGAGSTRAAQSHTQRRRKRPTAAEAAAYQAPLNSYQAPLNWHLVGQTAYY